MIEQIGNFIINLISSLGYPGIIITMAIESALIPLPSEIIMPFSGYLVSQGVFNIHLVALSGAVGNLIGSSIAYGLGYYGHEKLIKNFIKKWGKYILISEHELDKAQSWIKQYKDSVILISRVLPGVRTVISLPAGYSKIPFLRFGILTFIGSLIWSYFLAYLGYILGSNWRVLGPYFHKADTLIIGLVIILVAFYIYHKLHKSRST